MKIDDIKRAREEAADFIVKCNDLLKFQEEKKSEYIFGSKQSGELRRQSMRLTRELARMRKP
jgi:hypothetical protein